jgi:hypothetical protein
MLYKYFMKTIFVFLICTLFNTIGAYAASIQNCIPAANTAFTKLYMPSGGVTDFNTLAKACSGGATAVQITNCIPSANAAFTKLYMPASGVVDFDTLAKACSKANRE